LPYLTNIKAKKVGKGPSSQRKKSTSKMGESLVQLRAERASVIICCRTEGKGRSFPAESMKRGENLRGREDEKNGKEMAYAFFRMRKGEKKNSKRS